MMDLCLKYLAELFDSPFSVRGGVHPDRTTAGFFTSANSTSETHRDDCPILRVSYRSCHGTKGFNLAYHSTLMNAVKAL